MTTSNLQEFRGRAAASGEEIEPAFAISQVDDVAAVCAAADAAFDTYRAMPSEARATFLEAIGEEILALGDALLDRAHIESGLPLPRLTGERGRTINQLRLFADVVRADRWRGVRVDPALPDREPLPRPDLRLRMIPLGPVAVFGASNFPLAFSTAGGDTASALAAGCPVVVKGHPAHPGTDSMVAGAIAKAAQRTGMPGGVFGHIMGSGNELGERLVSDPRIAAVGFTGSRAGGLALAKLAQQREVPIPVFAEMSSVNPVVLMPNALAERAEELGKAFVASLTMGAGQFCTNPGVVIAVGGADLAEFERTAGVALSGQAAQTMLTQGISEAYERGKSRLSALDAVDALAVGERAEGPTCGSAALFAIEGDHVLDDPAILEEMFGAASIIVRCRDMAQLRTILSAMEGQLTATLQIASGDHDDAARIVPILERKAGRILVNGWPTGVEVAHAMVHGGPFPATSDARTTSVGTLAIDRFLRPVCYQDFPQDILPPELVDGSAVPQLRDGKMA